MKLIIPILLIITFCASAQAGVYKRIDANGNVEYSDVPQKKTDKPVDLPPPTPYTPPPAPATDPQTTGEPGAQQQPVAGYDSVVITQPKDDESIRENEGNLTVTVTSTPPLLPNNEFALLIDDKKVATGQNTTLQVPDVERGTHTLQVLIEDADGNEIARSESITFHMLRFSSLLKPGSAPSPYTMPAPYRTAP